MKTVLLSRLIPAVYIQLSPERITLRNAKTGESTSDVPDGATNPFGHPRSLVSDFLAGEQ